MRERTEKVEKILERYENKQKEIEKRYSTKNIIEEIERLNIKIDVHDLGIKELQDELSKIPAVERNTALIKQYQERIEALENGFFDKSKTNIKIERLQAELSETPQNYGEKRKTIQDEIERLKGGSEDSWLEGKNHYLKEKQKLEAELKQRDSHKEVAERERRDIDDKLRSDLSQERIAIDKDIDNTKLKIQREEIDSKLKYQEIKDFKYEYEEYEEEDEKGNKITKKRIINEDELKKLNEEYKKLQNNIKTQREILKDLQEAKTICNKELAIFKQKDKEKAEALGKAWNETKNNKEESKEKEKGKKGEKDKDKEKEKEKEPKKQSSSTKQWHSALTEEQIDELKAEGIEPGDSEYNTYLKNHGLEVEKQKENKREEKKENNWHSKLTQEQIDELKAEGIEPGDQEYDMYLKNHGFEVEKQKKNKREEKKENKWHSALTEEQIDELKAEGIEPGDSEYDMYLKNHGLEVEKQKENKQEKDKDKVKWASGLTQEQIDELKSAGIQPGDIEYYIYLRDHGIKLDWQGSYKGQEEDKIKWASNLTQEQIDELKSAGIQPGDIEYYMYLREHGIKLDWQKGSDKQEEKDKQEKITEINVLEGKGIIIWKDSEGRENSATIEEAFKEKSKKFKRLDITKKCNEIAGGPIRGFLLKRRVNPEYVMALGKYGNSEQLKEYISSIHNKEEVPFKSIHDLGEMGFFDRLKRNKFIGKEKRSGIKVFGKWFNKNKALKEGESVELLDESRKTKVETQDNEKRTENKFRTKVRVENSKNQIEEKANKAVKGQEEKQSAQEVGNINPFNPTPEGEWHKVGR